MMIFRLYRSAELTTATEAYNENLLLLLLILYNNEVIIIIQCRRSIFTYILYTCTSIVSRYVHTYDPVKYMRRCARLQKTIFAIDGRSRRRQKSRLYLYIDIDLRPDPRPATLHRRPLRSRRCHNNLGPVRSLLLNWI